MSCKRFFLIYCLFTGLIILSATSTIPAVEIIGHRGASDSAPENTLASVNLAWQRNADAVEIDIQLTKDGQIVAYHDKTTKRIGGRDQAVKEQTLTQLQMLDVGAWKNPQYSGEKIPALTQILKTIPDKKRLFIEIKCGVEVLPLLKRDLNASGKTPAQTVLIGFDYEIMRQAKQLFPERKVFWVFKAKRDNETGDWEHNADYYIQKANAAQLDGLDIGFNKFITKEFVQQAQAADLPVYIWTVNSVADARKLTEMGVKGITTDRPGLLTSVFKAAK